MRFELVDEPKSIEPKEYKIRPMEKGDESFVLGTWLINYKRDSYFAKRIRNNIYFEYHTKVANSILARPSSKTYVACDQTDPNVLYGYIVTEQVLGFDIVHFCFIKGAFRNFGLARDLYKATGFDPKKTTFTHWTKRMDSITKRHPELTYCPYLV
jgi:hypothetical protein